ncbi:hypothetical protein QBL02_05060 [Leucobacter sp. UT-8R-CII-1-4]|uniref:aggregation-promoting factor C-terminal-like domain-containing protein n=1 Tax=Leucobacter sp. UT-8R-CII-1-4 TaxID=3040075 RepID=UPI0024A93AFF|nr:transglycosylase SLT domain-containing protein [Leucobacter sp. UT-8R-CII-1-4]MDI6022909.1 hypothetical protein [Leucobacter sp. UT-8R-CII-1-4]
MTLATNTPTAPHRMKRLRGYLAAFAVAGIAGTAIIAPLSQSKPALADEAFYERINQEFVPTLVDAPIIPLATAPAEEMAPEPPPVAETKSSAGGSGPIFYTGGGAPAEWMAAAGIDPSDWGYVDYVVSRESGWNPNATNSGSGACGLVQALPCSKVPGNGYDPVDNLRWANGYAVGRYGSWAGAYDFWVSNSWW